MTLWNSVKLGLDNIIIKLYLQRNYTGIVTGLCNPKKKYIVSHLCCSETTRNLAIFKKYFDAKPCNFQSIGEFFPLTKRNSLKNNDRTEVAEMMVIDERFYAPETLAFISA